MIRTLCWKECREHVGVWALLGAATVLLVVGVGLILASGGLGNIALDNTVRSNLLGLTTCLGVAYGLVAGARTLAGEREGGTLAFLDAQLSRRLPLWRVKALTGAAFALGQALLLLGLIALLGLDSPRGGAAIFWILPVLILDGYAWGLAGSALARSVFGAALIGAGLTAVSWSVTIILGNLSGGADGLMWLARAAMAATAVVLSANVFCRPDRERRTLSDRSGPSPGRTLVWLTYRQGRGEALIVLVAGLVLGLLLPSADLMLWPLAVLSLGAICGTAVFGEDHAGGGYRFLAGQRLPPWQVWSVKTLLWLAWSAVAAAVLGLSVLLRLATEGRPAAHRGDVGDEPMYLFPGTGMVLGLAFLLLHGFAVGQLVGMLLRRRGLAELVAVTLSACAAVLWLPSVACGGLAWWQLLVAPLFLLAAARAAYWPWVSERLATWRAALTIGGAAALAALWVAGSLWYRVAEIPDAGEPFDRAAFERSLAQLQGSETGPLLREAAAELKEQKERTLAKLEPPRGGAPGDAVEPDDEIRTKGYGILIGEQLAEVSKKGWPEKEPALGKFLDAMFAESWAAKYRTVAALPLGMVRDPRLVSIETGLDGVYESMEAATLFTARAAQLQARGESGLALDHLLTALGLSRQVRNKAPIFGAQCGTGIELAACEGAQVWLTKVGPQRELLARALARLTRHEAEVPPFADNVKAGYYVFRNRLDDQVRPGHGLEGWLFTLGRQAPWESERERRLVNLLFACQVRCAELPYAELSRDQEESGPVRCADVLREPPSAPWVRAALGMRWGQYVYFVTRGAWLETQARARCEVRALQLQTALALYEIDNEKPARELSDLVPKYLKELPRDPYSGRPFGYRVSGGEQVKVHIPENAPNPERREVAKGQGVIWSVGPDGVDHGGVAHGSELGTLYPAEWERYRLDLVYLVPRWDKR